MSLHSTQKRYPVKIQVKKKDIQYDENISSGDIQPQDDDDPDRDQN